ncbi:hypothetical protein SAMN05421800_11551 [Chryseobacterium balustinum]|uniref:Uncharacterized protein n=2 Tax=Chryseobacterium balustinum TaxID=246 RepID=A0ABY1LBG8_9FLAO|nr:hypothetical protein SAMN05421800_11551 [Chryseobacterium balustinum]
MSDLTDKFVFQIKKMEILNSNKFKIQSGFIKSLFIVDDENKADAKLKINEKLFFEKLHSFLPDFDWELDATHFKKLESLSLYHKSHRSPSEPDILIELSLFEEAMNDGKKYVIKIQS